MKYWNFGKKKFLSATFKKKKINKPTAAIAFDKINTHI